MADSRAALLLVRWAVIMGILIGAALAFVGSVHASSSQLGNASSSQGARGRNYEFHFRRVERCFLRAINRSRARHKLRRLKWDRQIGFVARRHARAMARARDVAHDDYLGGRLTGWRALGQNSGSGKSCGQLVWAFWRSGGHRSNILGRWNYVGVGVKRARGGRVYVQQVFENRANPDNIYRFP
jgi:uncharacterized protein YkwD